MMLTEMQRWQLRTECLSYHNFGAFIDVNAPAYVPCDEEIPRLKETEMTYHFDPTSDTITFSRFRVPTPQPDPAKREAAVKANDAAYDAAVDKANATTYNTGFADGVQAQKAKQEREKAQTDLYTETSRKLDLRDAEKRGYERAQAERDASQYDERAEVRRKALADARRVLDAAYTRALLYGVFTADDIADLNHRIGAL